DGGFVLSPVNIRASAFWRFWGWLGSRTQMFWFRSSPCWASGVGSSRVGLQVGQVRACVRSPPQSRHRPDSFALFVLGVGSSATATESVINTFPPFALSASRRANQFSTSSPSLNTPAFGVGSSDEDPEPLVWRSRVASAYATPARVIPEGGQVPEYGTECPHSRLRSVVSQAPRAGFHVAMGWGTENSSHVLDHDQLWS